MTRGAVRTQRLIAASRVSLWWERAWAASWRGLTVLGAGLALALFDVWAELPAGPRILALSALFIAAAAFFWLDWRAVFWPSREAGLRALEDANGLVHRPLSAAEDALAAGQGDPLTEALWRRHVARQLAAYAKLEPVWPKPGVPVRDPYAMRGAVFLALVAGFAVAGSDAPSRIASAFSTEEAKGALAPGVALDAWITPPAYTGLAPIILAQSKATVPLEADRQIAVPIGSKLTLRLDGTTSPSVQRIPLDGGDSAELVPEGAAANGSFTTELELTGSERLRVQAGGRKAGDWEITVLPDAPPSIAFDGELAATPRQATRVPFKAGDDYGVAAAEAQIRLAPEAQEGDDPTAEEGEDVIVMKLPVNGGDGKALKNAAFEDLTAHPWAGLEVVVQLVATDATGQTGLSPEQRFTLPERTFKDPLARAIVEQRKNLSRGPGAIPGVAQALEAFTLAPERFNMKGQVYLGLRSAYWRLIQSQVHKDVTGVQALLWDIALSIEDGGVTLAADEVRRLQKELQAALDRNAPDEEIARLTEELRQAMREMMSAMVKSAPAEMIPFVDGESVDAQDLESMLDRIEEMSRLGDKDAAKQLLSDLQNMMEGMDGPPSQPSEKEKQLAETLSELNKIIREQEKLRDRTFRQDQLAPGEEPAEGDKQQGELPDEQGKLGDELGGLKEKLGEEGGKAPGEMGEAKDAMEGAEGALKQSETGEALAFQDEALAKLKSARDAARQALAEEQKKNGGTRIGRGPGRRGPGRDPAGRPDNGMLEDGSVKIPTERETQRAREILNELRKRSGETGRPQDELNYLERLLRRF
jgi:uncharacterized protein (TIGR02302 family)